VRRSAVIAGLRPEWVRAVAEEVLPKDVLGAYVAFDSEAEGRLESPREVQLLAVTPGILLGCGVIYTMASKGEFLAQFDSVDVPLSTVKDVRYKGEMYVGDTTVPLRKEQIRISLEADLGSWKSPIVLPDKSYWPDDARLQLESARNFLGMLEVALGTYHAKEVEEKE
jgi:hypothetical protein